MVIEENEEDEEEAPVVRIQTLSDVSWLASAHVHEVT